MIVPPLCMYLKWNVWFRCCDIIGCVFMRYKFALLTFKKSTIKIEVNSPVNQCR